MRLPPHLVCLAMTGVLALSVVGCFGSPNGPPATPNVPVPEPPPPETPDGPAIPTPARMETPPETNVTAEPPAEPEIHIPYAVTEEAVPRVFFTNQVGRNVDSVFLDGQRLTNLQVGEIQTPRGITVDPVMQKIYWCDYGTHSIRRANFDGSDVEAVITDSAAGFRGIAVDGERQHIYWTDQELRAVFRADCSGDQIETLIDTELEYPYAIALDLQHGKLYVEDHAAQAIFRANLGGTEFERFVELDIDERLIPSGLAIDVDHDTLYYAEGSIHGRIKRVSISTPGVPTIIREANVVRGLAIERSLQKLVWSEQVGEETVLRKSDLDGTDA
ncbi:MAG: hypothetical protein KDA60_18890, partial [Planctomycetales bacterium]|nr:hypothetical protein [Planctomycetales bacterium]